MPLIPLSLIKGPSSRVVIEIGTDLLKILEIREEKSRGLKHLLKITPLDSIKQPLYEEIPQIFEEMGIKNRRVLTYLPRNLVNMRLLEIPSTDPKEINDIVQLQGVKQTPYSREEVAISYRMIEGKKEGHSSVVLAFCQHKFVDERVDILERSGLKVEFVGVGSEGTYNWYIQNLKRNNTAFPESLTVLISQDTSFSDIIFCKGEEFIFSKSILRGSNRTDVLYKESIDEFSEEVLQAIEVSQEEIQIKAPKKGYLIGPLKEMAKLKEGLEAKLKFPVELIDPLGDLNLDEISSLERGSFSSLIGFGDKKIPLLFNLTPEEIRLQQSVEKKGKELLQTGGLLAALSITAVLFFAGHFYKKGNYITELDAEIRKTEAVAEKTEEKLSRLKLMKFKRNASTSFLSYVREIVNVLPNGIYFNSIAFDEGENIVLTGYAMEMSEVFNYVKTLEDLKIFKGVKSEHVSKKKIGERMMADFEIFCRL